MLYVSGDGVSLSNMKELFGISEMEKIPLPERHAAIRFKAGFQCGISADFRNRFHSFASEPAAWYPDGAPAMLKHRCGKGTAYYLSLPLEASLAKEPFAFDRSEAWKLYSGLKEAAGLESVVDYPDPQCERCWNPDQEGHGWLTVINHRREAVEAGLTSSRRILAVSRIAGEAEITGTRIRLEPLQAAIFEVSLGA